MITDGNLMRTASPRYRLQVCASWAAAFPRCALVSALALGCASVVAADGGSFPVTIRVDAAHAKGELKPIWRFFGADEPNYAYMKHGQKLLA